MKHMILVALFMTTYNAFAQSNDLKFCREQYLQIGQNLKYIEETPMDQRELKARIEIQRLTLEIVNTTCDHLLGKRKNQKLNQEVTGTIDWDKIAKEAVEATDAKLGIKMN